MADAWGQSWGVAWGNSFGADVASAVGTLLYGGGDDDAPQIERPFQRRNRPKTIAEHVAEQLAIQKTERMMRRLGAKPVPSPTIVATRIANHAMPQKWNEEEEIMLLLAA